MRKSFALYALVCLALLSTSTVGCTGCGGPSGAIVLQITVDATANVGLVDLLDVTVTTAGGMQTSMYMPATGGTFNFPVLLPDLTISGLTGLATVTVDGTYMGAAAGTGNGAVTLVTGTVPITVTLDSGGPGKCGNGTVDAGEACDDGNMTNGDGCENDCTVTPTVCGDGTVDAGEECDDGNTTNGDGCSSVCAIEPLTCDGGACDPTEDCTNCPLDCGACPGACGDGTVDPGEDCDGGNLSMTDCIDLGFTGGTLACDASCNFNTAGCTGGGPVCGDGVIDPGEDCDGTNLGGSTCSSLGFSGGTLSCNASCIFNTAACTTAMGCAGMPNGTPCSDMNLCTTGDACSAGVCVGTTVDCSALTNSCNTGSCSAATGACVATPLPNGTACADTLTCTTGTTCTTGVCGGGFSIDCSAFDSACAVGACAEPGGCYASAYADGTPCDDGDVCTDDTCISGACNGFAIGNDCDIYTGLVGGFIDISASATATMLATISSDFQDDAIDTVTLPFMFPYFGTLQDTISPVTNGWINVGAGTSADFGNTALPSFEGPAIFAFWDDLYSNTTGDVWIDYRGSSPNQMAIIQWKNYTHLSDNGARLNFEVIIHENGNIQVLYETSTAGAAGFLGVTYNLGADATAGIDSGVGPYLQYSYLTASLVPGLIINYLDDGAGGYVMSSEVNHVGTWTDTRSTGTVVGATTGASDCDDCSTAVALPFVFNFFGTNFGPGQAAGVNVNIVSNGNVQFGTAPNSAFGNVALPSATAPSNMVACFWDDLQSATGGEIRTLTVGTTPNRLFVIQWVNVSFFSGAGNVDMETVLHETTNAIDCLYGPSTGTTDQVIGNSATVGLNNAGGTVGYQASFGAANLGQGAVVSFIPTSNGSTAAYTIAGPNNLFPDISRAAGVLTSLAGTGDDVSEVVPLGFTFTYYGVPYTTVNLCDNGFMNFGASTCPFGASGIPGGLFSGHPDAMIAGHWGDLDTSINPGAVYYVTSGPIGDQVFTVQWQSQNNWASSATTGTDMTYTIQIFESTGEVIISYGAMVNVTATNASGGSSVTGIENDGALSGIEMGDFQNGTSLSGSRFIFYP